jgi:hypothetical protein
MRIVRLVHCFLALLILQQAIPKAHCQVPPQAVAPNALPQPSPIQAMKKSVVFLEADCIETDLNGSKFISPHAGTAFLVSVADPRLKTRQFTYLVTNRHVAQPGVEDGKPCELANYVLRVDAKTPLPGGSYSVIQTMPISMMRWSFSDDPSVDLAVTPIGLSSEALDVVYVPSDLLLTDQEAKTQAITEGDSVLFTGLFVQMVGQVHSEPIVREGKIAMVPREKMPTTLHSLGAVYLVDSHVFGGNSGSPMFVNLAGERAGNLIVGVNYKLLGVVSGYVQESSNFSLQAVAAYAGTVTANSGIAMVVPAQNILDILNSVEMQKQRDVAVEALQPK